MTNTCTDVHDVALCRSYVALNATGVSPYHVCGFLDGHSGCHTCRDDGCTISWTNTCAWVRITTSVAEER